MKNRQLGERGSHVGKRVRKITGQIDSQVR